MKTLRISQQRLRELISEEIERAVVNEFVDHSSISTVTTATSRLLAAIEQFKEKAPPAAINAVTPHLSELERVLENMMTSPGSYVPVPKREPRTVTLSNQSSDKK